MNDILRRIYYDPNHEAGFASVAKLVKASGISRKNVEKWLQGQETYSLHKQARKKFATRKYRTSGIDHQWQADLVDMQKYAYANDGIKWILTVIDIFSRFAWAKPIRSKVAKHVQEGFDEIFATGRQPRNLLQTDQGNEFQSAAMQQYWETHNIHQFSVKSQFKAALVERFNRTLRNRMQGFFTESKKYRWLEVLPKLVNGYNKSDHRIIEMAPIEVVKSNEMQLWDKQELTPQIRRGQRKRIPFAVGMHVRVSKTKYTFEKGYMPNWTVEVFKISEILDTDPVQVKIVDLRDEEIEGSWYLQEIQRVDLPETFQIEKVLQERRVGRRKEYLVKWVGYSYKFNEWVPENRMIQIAEATVGQ